MFSKNTYLLPQVSSSLYPRATSSVVDLNGVEILLHHHPDMFSGHYLAANAPIIQAATLLNQDDGGLNGDPSAVANTFQRKQTVKKDRHSKIFTAQGPRDRRVRLSIGIARKFFDLQEMLGFDKPSKTLDWLLTKSKAAIKELVQTKQNASASAKSSSSSSECELLSSVGNGDVFEYGNSLGADSKRKFGNKHKGAKDPQQAASNLAKESRAKARARARERTREKMCIKQLNGARNTGSDLNPSIPMQYRNNQLEVFQLSAGSSSNNLSCLKANAGIREPIFHCPLTNEAATEDLIQESIVIKRKSKNPSFFGFQQNLIVSRDLSSNYGIPSANTTENWDICSFTSQSNLCAILDQHKFINSTSNI
ncbi:hypothetical protein Pfo_008787 [Paulownia fortunei]|nr:hypothetical protein Pfo_008787 [Paulownia fortunei]